MTVGFCTDCKHRNLLGSDEPCYECVVARDEKGNYLSPSWEPAQSEDVEKQNLIEQWIEKWGVNLDWEAKAELRKAVETCKKEE